MPSTVFYLGRFLKKLADDQCSSITKGSIYHIKHNVHTASYHSSGLTRNFMFNGSIYFMFMFADTAFLLGAADQTNLGVPSLNASEFKSMTSPFSYSYTQGPICVPVPWTEERIAQKKTNNFIEAMVNRLPNSTVTSKFTVTGHPYRTGRESDILVYFDLYMYNANKLLAFFMPYMLVSITFLHNYNRTGIIFCGKHFRLFGSLDRFVIMEFFIHLHSKWRKW